MQKSIKSTFPDYREELNNLNRLLVEDHEGGIDRPSSVADLWHLQSIRSIKGRGRENTMKRRIFSLLLMLVTLVCIFSAGEADAITALYGHCDENIYYFYFKADGNSSITFCQYTGIEKGLLDISKEENGLYHIKYGLAGQAMKQVDWEHTIAIGDIDTYTLYLNDPGVYEIMVIPYTDEEINDAYLIDHFGGWKKNPKWYVDHCEGGQFSLQNDFVCDHGVTVEYGNGKVDYFANDEYTHYVIQGTDVYCFSCGQYLYSGDNIYSTEAHTFRGNTCTLCGYTPVQTSTSAGATHAPSGSGNHVSGVYVPYLGNRTISGDEQCFAVYWVQAQLRQTGNYYLRTANGAHWDVTGNFGDHTMQEVQRFMQNQGYYSDGTITQSVIDAITAYFSRTGKAMADVRPDGIYDYMSSVMSGDAGGSMDTIRLGDYGYKVRWIQTCLQGCGYYSGTIDGQYGSTTSAAVRQFQEDYDFVERDFVKLGHARKMLEVYYQKGNALSNLP